MRDNTHNTIVSLIKALPNRDLVNDLLGCSLVDYYLERTLEDVGLTETAIDDLEAQGEHGLAVAARQSRSRITDLFKEIGKVTGNWFEFQDAGCRD